MSAFGSISEVGAYNCHVRFPAISDQTAASPEVRFVPTTAEVFVGPKRAYSLFSLSIIAIVGELGIMRPAIRPKGATEANVKWRKN